MTPNLNHAQDRLYRTRRDSFAYALNLRCDFLSSNNSSNPSWSSTLEQECHTAVRFLESPTVNLDHVLDDRAQPIRQPLLHPLRSEEHTSELQSQP